MNLFLQFGLQLLLLVGVPALFGFLLFAARHGLCRATGKLGRGFLVVTGVVGTPVHELSHAALCLVFLHKIKRIRLYRPFAKDEILGYVEHSYRPKNVYHQIGNFFIGIAPIFGGCGFLLLMMRLLLPGVYGATAVEMASVMQHGIQDFGGYFLALGRIALGIFRVEYFSSALFWVFVVLAVMVTSHMELSTSDIRSSIWGFLILVGLWLGVDTLLYFLFPNALAAFTGFSWMAASAMASYFSLGVVFAAGLVAVASLFALLRWLIRRLFAK